MDERQPANDNVHIVDGVETDASPDHTLENENAVNISENVP